MYYKSDNIRHFCFKWLRQIYVQLQYWFAAKTLTYYTLSFEVQTNLTGTRSVPVVVTSHNRTHISKHRTNAREHVDNMCLQIFSSVCLCVRVNVSVGEYAVACTVKRSRLFQSQ